MLCLQETKAAWAEHRAASDVRAARLSRRPRRPGAYNGVAVRHDSPPREACPPVEFDDEHLDREPRITSCLVDTPEPMRVVSVYVPHGRTVDHWHYQYKLAFLDALAERLRQWLLHDAHVVSPATSTSRRPTATCSIPMRSSAPHT